MYIDSEMLIQNLIPGLWGRLYLHYTEILFRDGLYDPVVLYWFIYWDRGHHSGFPSATNQYTSMAITSATNFWHNIWQHENGYNICH